LLTLANWTVTAVFALGMVAGFLTPYQEPLWMGGKWVKNHRRIAYRYVTSWFIIDLLATIPLDDLAAMAMTSGSTNGDDQESNQDATDALRSVRTVRLARLIRLTRLVRLGRLAKATRIMSHVMELIEKHSELLNISYTVRTALFWMGVVFFMVHWFCCSWGILAMLQDSQRTPSLIGAISHECSQGVLRHLNTTNERSSDCLIECEIETLAELDGVNTDYVGNMEPWICRRISDGLFTGELGSEIYYYLLHHEGLMKNVAGKTGRPEENIMFFVISYLYLVLRTVFIGAISGARANANPLGKAWQSRMDHLNLFLREMHAPADLRQRTRAFLRNTRNLEHKKSFISVFHNFSRGLAGEMQSFMSLSVLRGIEFFSECESGFLRDLVTKMKYVAVDRGERLILSEPTLGIVSTGTLVIGGKPVSAGQCVFPDILIKSDALLDRRVPCALTYCEVCCLTRSDIYATAASYPESAKHLRFEAFKIAMFRSTQMLAQFVSTRGHSPQSVGEALCNLGEDVEPRIAEVHTYFRAINGGARLRGLASEQQNSSDANLALKAREAVELAHSGNVLGGKKPALKDDVLIDEDGKMLDKLDVKGHKQTYEQDPHEKLASEVRSEMKRTREEVAAAHQELREEMASQMQPLVQMQSEMQQLLLAVQALSQENTRSRHRRKSEHTKSRPERYVEPVGVVRACAANGNGMASASHGAAAILLQNGCEGGAARETPTVSPQPRGSRSRSRSRLEAALTSPRPAEQQQQQQPEQPEQQPAPSGGGTALEPIADDYDLSA